MRHIWLLLGIIFTLLGWYYLIDSTNYLFAAKTEGNLKSKSTIPNARIINDKFPITSRRNPSTIIMRPNRSDRVIITIPAGREVRQDFILTNRTQRNINNQKREDNDQSTTTENEAELE